MKVPIKIHQKTQKFKLEIALGELKEEPNKTILAKDA